jgi:hypothetical protein
MTEETYIEIQNLTTFIRNIEAAREFSIKRTWGERDENQKNRLVGAGCCIYIPANIGTYLMEQKAVELTKEFTRIFEPVLNIAKNRIKELLNVENQT